MGNMSKTKKRTTVGAHLQGADGQHNRNQKTDIGGSTIVGRRWATQPKPINGQRWEHNCGRQMGNTTETKQRTTVGAQLWGQMGNTTETKKRTTVGAHLRVADGQHNRNQKTDNGGSKNVGGRWATQPKPKDGQRWEHKCGRQMGNTTETKKRTTVGAPQPGQIWAKAGPCKSDKRIRQSWG